jgi:1,4-alpha-glucan branching enzyme
MGGELGQWAEWDHDGSLDWHLLEAGPHRGIQRWVQDLNRAYRSEPALHLLDTDHFGFEWVDPNDHEQSVLSFMRYGGADAAPVAVVCNFTPVPRHNYRLGVSRDGFWKEILNGDAAEYGGSGQGNFGGVEAAPVPYHGRQHSLNVTVPPLAAVFFRHGSDA